MNRKEWIKACKDGIAPRRYDNASREIQKSLKYNTNPEATVRHHLMDTPEQIAYNNAHYELWGFEIDESGNEHFEYGKYVIFVTKKEHTEIHKNSEETRKKISMSNKGRPCPESIKEMFRQMYKGRRLCPPVSDETRRKISLANKGKKRSQEFKDHLKEINSGKRNPMYGKSPANKGKPMSDEQKKKIGEANRGKKMPPISNETREKLSNAKRGRIITDTHRIRISQGRLNSSKARAAINNTRVCKDHYDTFIKQNGINISWNQFQKLFTNNYCLLKTILILLVQQR